MARLIIMERKKPEVPFNAPAVISTSLLKAKPVASPEIRPVAATGYACTEASCGLLYHWYRLDVVASSRRRRS